MLALSRVGSSTCCLSDFRNALAFAGAMVVTGRLQWILEKIRLGHQVLVTSSFCTERQRQKLKVLVQPVAGMISDPEINQCFAMAAVMNMLHIASSEHLAKSFCFMDRGHKHSSGVSEVAFWMEVKVQIISGGDEGAVAACIEREEVECTALDGDSLASKVIIADVGDEEKELCGSWPVGSVGGGKVLSGFGGDTEDSGPAGSVYRSEGATGSKDRNTVGVFTGIGVDMEVLRLDNHMSSTDDQEEGGSKPKKHRVLVEM